MYAILRNNKLYTPGHDGEQFTTAADAPGFYLVLTRRERDGVVEFGSGVVMVVWSMLHSCNDVGAVDLPIADHRVDFRRDICPVLT